MSDGINVAAKREGIAEPAGICIFRQAFDQVNRSLVARKISGRLERRVDPDQFRSEVRCRNPAC